MKLNDGESVLGFSCGGGGYGSPFEREPERVARDVVEGWISVEHALQVYGVVVDTEGNIDSDATIKQRASAVAEA